MPDHRAALAAEGDTTRPPGLGDVTEEQAALRRVAAVAAGADPPEAVFDAVTAEGSSLLGGALVSLARWEQDGSGLVILAQTGGHVSVGGWCPASNSAGLNARMWKSGRPERADDVTLVGMPAGVTGGFGACVAVPVFANGVLWGSLAAASRTGPLPAETEDRLTVFAEIVAAAVVSAATRTSVRVFGC